MNAQQASVDNGLPDEGRAIIQSLSPALLWEHFGTLCTIPRDSKEESAIADHIFSLAIEKDYPVKRDPLHNLLVTIPATAGMETLPFLCIQSHIDMVMVNEGEGAQFPLKLQLEGEKLTATKTTLGADNGIGVAAMMAIMTDETLEHGPLELLFTTQEEIGLIGAEQFDYSRVQSKRFLNLDSEEEGIVYVGCAGGGRIEATFKKEVVPVTPDSFGFEMEFSAFLGGHSGLMIHEDRGNPIVLLGHLLLRCQEVEAEIVSINGGEKMNAIPTSAKAVVMVPAAAAATFQKLVGNFVADVFRRYKKEKPVFRMVRIVVDGTEKVFSIGTTAGVLSALTTIPVGALSMEQNAPSMTQTSNNLGMLRTGDESITVTSMYRSSLEKELDAIEGNIRFIFAEAGAALTIDSRYSPWEPQFDTALLALVKECAEKVLQKEVTPQTIHAGLECACFYKHLPGVEIVSFGPTMGDVHTAKEWVSVASVARFWNILTSILSAS